MCDGLVLEGKMCHLSMDLFGCQPKYLASISNWCLKQLVKLHEIGQ